MAPPAVLYPPNYVFLDADGVPIAGGFVYTYEAGTSTPLATYSDVDLSIPNDNPLELNSSGFSDTMMYCLPQSYKVNLEDADNVQVAGWPVDNYGVAVPDL